MMKKESNFIKTLVLLIAFFAFSINVSAEGCDIGTSGNGSYTSNSGASYSTHAYYATCDGGNKYVALCIDPGKQYKKNGSGWNFQAISSSSEFGKYASGLYTVFKQQYNSCNNGSDNGCILTFQNAIRKMIFSMPSLSSYQRGSTAGLANVYKDYQNHNISNIGSEDAIISAATSAGGSANASGVNANFQNTDNGMNLVVEGVAARPDQINYTVSNGTTGTINPNSGSLNGTTYTVSIPFETLDQILKCEEIIADIVYKNLGGNNGNGAIPASNVGIASPSSNDSGIRNIQSYLLFPLSGSEAHISATGNVGPSSIGYEVCDYVCREGDDCNPDEPPVCQFNATIACEEPASSDNTAHKVMTVNEGSIDGEGETDWEKCIIHNKDKAENGNSFDIEIGDVTPDEFSYYANGVWYRAKDAKFCTVSCKEKYEFDMPASKANVLVGTYFSFNIKNRSYGDSLYHAVVGVKGEKQCVTSGPGTSKTSRSKGIDIQGYQARVVSLRQQQVDFINAYYYNQAIANRLNEIKESFVSGNSYGLDTKFRDNSDGNPPSDANYSFNFNSWLSNETEWYQSASNIYETDGNSKLNVSVDKITQCSISNPNDVTSAINCNHYITGNAGQNFRNASGTIGYLVNSSYNYYNGRYDAASTFDVDPSIYVSSEYKYKEYDYNIPGTKICSYEDDILLGRRENCTGGESSNGSATAWANYQTEEQRKTAIENLINKFQNAADAAYGKVNSLSGIINQQNNGISKCFIQDNQDIDISNYAIEPKITFNYAETAYNNDPKDLVLMDGENVDEVNPKYNYCGVYYSGNAAGVFNCYDSSSTAYYVNYIKVNGGDASNPSVEVGNDGTKYYNVSRVGVTVKYECNGDFCYYGNPKTYYTYPPDGLVTTDSGTKNATIIEHDGHVYPVSIASTAGIKPYSLTFNGIGQYFDTKSTGRLMGDDDAVMSGDYRNIAVCNYEVVHPKRDCDPSIEDCDRDKTCKNIVNDSCINPDTGDYYKPGSNPSEANSCVQELLNQSCCNELKDIEDKGGMPGDGSLKSKYDEVCGPAEACTGFNIITSNYSGTSYADSAVVSGDYNNNGALRFSIRTVSLGNLFPNESNLPKGLNWDKNYIVNSKNGQYGSRGLEINEVIDLIQDAGESIYGGEPDYSITLTPQCLRELRAENGNYDNGFIEYNLKITENSSYIPGSEADNSDFFNKIKGYGCKVNKQKSSEGINTGHLKD